MVSTDNLNDALVPTTSCYRELSIRVGQFRHGGRADEERGAGVTSQYPPLSFGLMDISQDSRP